MSGHLPGFHDREAFYERVHRKKVEQDRMRFWNPATFSATCRTCYTLLHPGEGCPRCKRERDEEPKEEWTTSVTEFYEHVKTCSVCSRRAVRTRIKWPAAAEPWEPRVWGGIPASELLRWCKYHFGVEGDSWDYYLTVKLPGASRKVDGAEPCGELPVTDDHLTVELNLVRAI